MKTLKIMVFLLIVVFICSNKVLTNVESQYGKCMPAYYNSNTIFSGTLLDSSYLYAKVINNIGTYLYKALTFNNRIFSYGPGFEWPFGSGKYAIFSTGFTISAFYNGQLRMAAAMFDGEYKPGYVELVNDIPTGKTDSRFKFYKITKGDGASTNTDWLNWGNMVPFGAPYVDVNHNNIYEPLIDTPGVSNAKNTVFACLTDGFDSLRITITGFGGKTSPLFAEIHWLSWCYDSLILPDVQFMKLDIINKSNTQWDSVYFSICNDPDLGFSEDDYVGCDINRNIGFCYNADNMDGSGSGVSYGANPPAVGFRLLKGPSFNGNQNNGLSSFIYEVCAGCSAPVCEIEPFNAEQAYNFIKGLKKDGSHWLIPNTSPPQITKFVFSGDPETATGSLDGYRVQNCGGIDTGQTVTFPPADRRFVMNMGGSNFSMPAGSLQSIVFAQLIKRGTNNLNSVTVLKNYSDIVSNFYNTVGISNIGNTFPEKYSLSQNYPNPFNPKTIINFQIPAIHNGQVVLKVYDALGREVQTLVNESLKQGTYDVTFDGSSYSSGIYFYSLITESFFGTKKMLLLK